MMIIIIIAERYKMYSETQVFHSRHRRYCQHRPEM